MSMSLPQMDARAEAVWCQNHAHHTGITAGRAIRATAHAVTPECLDPTLSGWRVSEAGSDYRDSLQIRELAAAIADQAEALATSQIPVGQKHAQLARLRDNLETLAAWIGDDRPQPTRATAAVAPAKVKASPVSVLLTGVQQRCLVELARQTESGRWRAGLVPPRVLGCGPGTRAALERRGLLTSHNFPYSGVTITDAGRAALAELTRVGTEE